ncbi:MAG: hypothetical protein GWN93_15270, partial [Deltaproteobacteria bacterium]|nr:hypothetical protein [Deltaproteobacteria bacterium]
FSTYPRGYKLFFLVVMLSVLIVIPPDINADVENEIIEHNDDVVFVDNGGNGLHGLRGGIVFSPEDTQGYGYNHEEVVFNLMRK